MNSLVSYVFRCLPYHKVCFALSKSCKLFESSGPKLCCISFVTMTMNNFIICATSSFYVKRKMRCCVISQDINIYFTFMILPIYVSSSKEYYLINRNGAMCNKSVIRIQKIVLFFVWNFIRV